MVIMGSAPDAALKREIIGPANKLTKSMKRNLTVIVLAFIAAVVMSSCDDPKVAFNEQTLDIPYLFSEGYQDDIK